MPKKTDPELKARAARLLSEDQGEYSTLTAASAGGGQAGRCGEGVGAALGDPGRDRRRAA